jgi:hypothetical protein
MHEPACMLLQQLLLLRACMRTRACVVARVIDTVYHLIYSSAQTQVWRIEFPYINIRYTKIRFSTPTLSAFLGLAGQICLS